MSDENRFGSAVIEDGCIVIRVRIADLPVIVEGAWATGNLDTRWKLTDVAAFANDLVHEINREDEEGTNAVHRMFDFSFKEALEQGAEGIEEHEDQDA